MIVVVCPGQGSQTPGFLTPWLSEPRFRSHLESLSEAAQIDLVKHGTESDADTIRDTAVAQPLIVAAGLLALAALREGREGGIDAVAGHSVGELTAAAATGILSETDAMKLVRARSVAMAEAASLADTGMSAVLGADETELLALLDNLGLEPANFNGGGQIVVAGRLGALAQLKENPPAGSRIIPLQVAGAFHTRYMKPAVEHLRTAASGVEHHNPTIPIWTNHDGTRVESGNDFIDLLVGQVASPVRWDKTMAAFAAAGITGMIELAPAGALVGLARRGLKGVPTVAVKTPDDLAAAHELMDSER